MTKNRAPRRYFGRRDLFLIVGVLLIAAAGFFWKAHASGPRGTAEAEIYYNTKIVKTVMLDPGRRETFSVPGQPNVRIRVENGKIRFLSSTCRDKICIRSGDLSRPGESAACLPNKVVIIIVCVGKNNSYQADAYAT